MNEMKRYRKKAAAQLRFTWILFFFLAVSCCFIPALADTLGSIIQNEFAETTEYDVSLFFIATHGYSDGDGDLEMPFRGSLNQADIDAHTQSTTSLSFDTLASWLKQYVKGEVIVVLQSCGAGSAIYSTAAEQNTAGGTGSADDGAGFVSRAITAFAKADVIGSSQLGDSSNATGAAVEQVLCPGRLPPS